MLDAAGKIQADDKKATKRMLRQIEQTKEVSTLSPPCVKVKCTCTCTACLASAGSCLTCAFFIRARISFELA